MYSVTFKFLLQETQAHTIFELLHFTNISNMKLTKNKSKQIAQQAIQEEQQLNRAAASLICLIKFSLTHEGIKTSMQTYLSTENKPS